MVFIYCYSFIKETKLYLSSDKKSDIWAKANPNSSYIMYSDLNDVKASPKKVLLFSDTIFFLKFKLSVIFASNAITCRPAVKLLRIASHAQAMLPPKRSETQQVECFSFSKVQFTLPMQAKNPLCSHSYWKGFAYSYNTVILSVVLVVFRVSLIMLKMIQNFFSCSTSPLKQTSRMKFTSALEEQRGICRTKVSPCRRELSMFC